MLSDSEIEKNIDEILGLGWESEDKIILERLLKYFKTWKRWIPRALEDDIRYMMDLSIREKRKINELTAALNLESFNQPSNEDG